MAVSFGGLIFGTSIILSQYGFILCFSVLFDTFIMRTLMVPACVYVLGRFNWWPFFKVEPFRELAKDDSIEELFKEEE